MSLTLRATTIAILFVLTFLLNVKNVEAFTVPDFPSCLNAPQDKLEVSHSGTHGVPGDSRSFTGQDDVYFLDGKNFIMQCLCPPNNEGIQTNWWKVDNLSTEEIEALKTEGWIYIPDGSAWGLDSSKYLAKNLNYSCTVGGNGEENRSSGGSSESGGSSSGSSSSSSSSPSSVGAVLGLASTGNIASVYFFFLLGIVSVTLGFILTKITEHAT